MWVGSCCDGHGEQQVRGVSKWRYNWSGGGKEGGNQKQTKKYSGRQRSREWGRALKWLSTSGDKEASWGGTVDGIQIDLYLISEGGNRIFYPLPFTRGRRVWLCEADKRKVIYIFFYALSLGRKWGKLTDMFLKLHLDIVCRKCIKKVFHDLLCKITYSLIVRKEGSKCSMQLTYTLPVQ